MNDFEHELRLLLAVALNAGLLWPSVMLARRVATSRPQVCLDVLLLWWLGQYLIIGVLGLAGVLSLSSITATVGVTVVLTIAFYLRTARRNESPVPMFDREAGDGWPWLAGLCLVIGYAVVLIYRARVLPPMSDDPLTYHLPAAAEWLRTGRLAIHETWFFNPANSYSPLAGSMFAAWLMAPFGSDVAARFMQAPALVAIFLAAYQLTRALGARPIAGTLLATTAALCAPIIRQTALAKDDLFLTAFIVAGVAALADRSALRPWRIGIALGLSMSVKLTSVYAVAPILLLLVLQRPWRWREIFISAACIAVLAGPWFLRNAILFGNPIFPIGLRWGERTLLPGMFVTEVSPRLRIVSGLRETFFSGYFSVGYTVATMLLIAWLGALAFARRRAWAESLPQVCLIGPVLATAAFLLTSPYAEIRFLYPWVVIALCVVGQWRGAAQGVFSGAALIAALSTSFASDWVIELLPIAVLLAAGLGAITGLCSLGRRAQLITLAAGMVVAIAITWVHWRAYVTTLHEYAEVAWSQQYGDCGRAWAFLRTAARDDATIAYTGTYLTYPLFGERLHRRVLHVPVSAKVERLSDLPGFSQPASEANMLAQAEASAQADAHRATWLERLERSGATVVVVDRSPEASIEPVEYGWIASDERFKRLFASGALEIFRFTPDGR